MAGIGNAQSIGDLLVKKAYPKIEQGGRTKDGGDGDVDGKDLATHFAAAGDWYDPNQEHATQGGDFDDSQDKADALPAPEKKSIGDQVKAVFDGPESPGGKIGSALDGIRGQKELEAATRTIPNSAPKEAAVHSAWQKAYGSDE